MKRAVLFAILLSVLFGVHRALEPWRVSRSIPPWRPRIVVLVGIDTLRADRLGCYGYARATSPNIDLLAREGVLFESCYSPANATEFSFPSLFTGLYPQRFKDGKGLRGDVPTLASLFSSYGFATASFNAGGNLNASFGFSRGFDVYETPYDFCSLQETVPRAIRWLEGVQRAGARGLLFVHGYDVHVPYQKPLQFTNLFNQHPTKLGTLVQKGLEGQRISDFSFVDKKGRKVRLTPADCATVSDAYDGAIAYADLQVGLLVSAIHRLGLTDQVLVVVFGDHGEELFEHGNHAHGVTWYEEEVHVPFVFWGPGGVPQGRRVKGIVEEMDLLPTIADFVGMRQRLDVSGVSLREVVLGTEEVPGDAFAVSVVGPLGTIRTSRYRLMAPVGEVVNDKVRVQLFDMVADPGETVNLAGDPRYQGIVQSLHQKLLDRYRTHL